MPKQTNQAEAATTQEVVTLVVKTQGVDIMLTAGNHEAKAKRCLTEEQKAKMAAGRKAAAERRKAAAAAGSSGGDSDSSEDPSASTAPSPTQKGKKKALQHQVDALAAEIEALQARLAAAQEELEEMEDSSEDEELPRFKADGTLDKRYKVSKLIARSDGGLDLRFKATKKAVEKGIINPDGTLVKAEE
jgi:chaperonin cofactor prefoldin